MTLLRIAWRNLGRRRVRTALTTAANVFAVFIAILNLSVGAGSHERWIEQGVRLYPGHLEVTAADWRDQRTLEYGMRLAPEDLTALESLPAGATWAPRLETWALAIPDRDDSMGRAAMLVGVDPAREAAASRLAGLLASGRFFDGGDAPEVVLGSALARNLGVGVGERVILLSSDYYGSQAAGRFLVAGTLSVGEPELDGYLALARLGDLQAFLEFPDGVSHVAIFGRDSADVEPLRAALAAHFAEDGHELLTWRELLPDIVQFMRLDDIGNWLGNAILIGVVAFGLLNTVLMSVMERVREFGVMRALGVRRRQVFALVMLESALLSVLGTALGLALAVPLVLWLEGHPLPMTALSEAADDVASLFGIEAVIMFRLTPWHWGALPALLLALALLASIPPALRACRGRPADALRTL